MQIDREELKRAHEEINKIKNDLFVAGSEISLRKASPRALLIMVSRYGVNKEGLSIDEYLNKLHEAEKFPREKQIELILANKEKMLNERG